MDNKEIRIIVADDHPMIWAGITVRLAFLDPRIKIVATAINFTELEATLTMIPADIVFLDVSGMGKPAVDVLRRIMRSLPDVRVIVYSSEVGHLALMEEGAQGYVTKGESEHELLQAIYSL